MPGAVAHRGKHENHLGIEVSQGLTWKGWEPGREYTKHIVLKNVKVKTQKLKYSVPSTRFFSTIYPEPITLSAGTSFTLPITFRPLEKNIYKDRIRFHTNAGEFDVPITAVLPEYDVSVPELLDLKLCAVENVLRASFSIQNNSELETPYVWQTQAPFSLEPSEGVLEPHGSALCTVQFSPKAALVYEAAAVCKYGEGYKHSQNTQLIAIGKFPHLVVKGDSAPQAGNEVGLAFGQVAVGQSAEKWISVQNLSKVDAAFSLDYENGTRRLDSTFDCPHRRGLVPAMTAVKIPFSFSPLMVHATSVEYFTLQAHGTQVKTVIKCSGSSKGPCVRLAAHLINFGRVDAGETVFKVLTVINDTSVPAVVQFDIDYTESVFKFHQSCGKIDANSSSKIQIEFKPEHPINYHRRVACLVHNQPPIYVDLLGTCHTELGKPAVLKSKHVINYRRHVDRGLSVFPPEELYEMMKNGKLETDEIGALMYTEAEQLEKYCHPLTALSAQDEYFDDGYHSDTVRHTPHVSTDVHYVDFGQCTRGHPFIEPRTVNVTNHTKGKITVVWTGNQDRVFSLSPVTADIPPQKSAVFNVTFKPEAPNRFYSAELEGFAFYKSLRDYRLVEDQTQCPPWCVTVTCIGQTFLPGNETFRPMYELDSRKLLFPAVNVAESAYRTLLLYNTGTTPILYNFQDDKDGIFSVKPTKGVVRDGFQIFTVKCSPKDVQVYKNKINVHLNADDNNCQELLFCGSAESPQVYLPDEGEIYFRPTCIGTSAQRLYAVKNVSRIPLRFEWKLAHSEAELLSVKPRQGLIQPNESQSHVWTFKPISEEKVILKPKLVVWGQGQTTKSSGGKKRSFPVRAIGEGDLGSIKAEYAAFLPTPTDKSDETYVDFGNVIVGTSSRRAFTICNEGNCDLRYRLLVDQSIEGMESGPRTEPCALELATHEGILPARARAVIDATVRPHQRCFYQFTITYQIVTPESPDGPVSPERHLCHLLATGVYPTMAVTDARCSGAASQISKKHLWNLFAIDSLNTALDGDPSNPELKYSVKTRQSYRRRPSVYTRAIVDLNFGAAPVDSPDTVVYLMLENSGTVPVDFSFLLPSDLHIELEYWAESGDYDEDELHEMKVQDNRLFEVSPRRARMTPGQSCSVTLTYRHILPGTDRLPVLLKIEKGREILLNFVGVTVEPERPYLHFPSNKHTFTPVAIGKQTTPKQVYELYNGGSVPVKFEIDCEPLEQLRAENFDRSILECLTPSGEIQPGRHAAIEWMFTPLEAKTYMVDVPIHVTNGETALMTFTGIGYDERIMGETMAISDQMAFSGVPSQQAVVVPGQTSFLSTERISFGNVPLFSRSRQVVFVMNQSKDHVISYTWHVTNKQDRLYCSIAPQHGVVPPGESRMCRVMFTACDLPSFYDMDLVCEVVDETLMDKYKQELDAWEAECERQKVEFTITEHNLDADCRDEPEMSYTPQPADIDVRDDGARGHHVGSGPRPVSAGKLNSLEAICRSNVEMEALPKYRTLPPIKQLPADAEAYLTRFNQTMKALLWERPSPPEAFLLHLGVTARTHSIPEFQANFPDSSSGFFIDRCLSSRLAPVLKRKEEETEEEVTVIECSEEEGDILTATMANLLRSVLDDDDFLSAMAKIPDEPIPFFQQFSADLPIMPSPPHDPPHSALSGSVEPDDEEAASPVQDEPDSKSPSSMASGLEPELERLKVERQESQNPEEQPSPLNIPRIEVDSQLVCPSAESVLDPPPEHPSTPSPPPQQRTVSEVKQSLAAEQAFNERERIKRLPEFGNALDSIMENTLMNILTEAFAEEFSITSRPRVIALPPKPTSGKPTSGSQNNSRRSSRNSSKK